MNFYRLPRPALFLARTAKKDRPKARAIYAAIFGRLITSKGSQAVHHARRVKEAA